MEKRKILKRPAVTKGLPIGKSEDDMSASERVSRNKGKPGKARPGKPPGPSGVRG